MREILKEQFRRIVEAVGTATTVDEAIAIENAGVDANCNCSYKK